MRIVIWGTGIICEEFKKTLVKDADIVGYIESKPRLEAYCGREVFSPEKFFSTPFDYDYIFVASVYSNEIFDTCLKLKADLLKVCFLRPIKSTLNFETYIRRLDILAEVAPDYIAAANLENGKYMRIDSVSLPELNCYPLYDYDYFRYRTFELVADQLCDLEGDVAEVGVFKGYFARIINAKFPQSKCWLFDTFEGFDKEEADKERKEGHCDDIFIETFKDTSVEQVLEKMPYRDNCIIMRGYFPETAYGINAVFKFVSIDLDFETSIYNAIDWFYPRLVNGGIIFLHDYNEPNLLGVRKAVKKYETKYGVLKKVPIADKCGTLIIIK